MQTLTIAAVKGGAATTTTTLNLAGILACERGQRVLVVDLDPDADATRFWGLELDDDAAAVQRGQASFADIARPTGIAGIDLVPAFTGLKASAVRLAEDPLIAGWVSDGLAGADSAYDVVLFDVPAGIGVDGMSAALATGRVLATSLLEGGDQHSLASMVRDLRRLQARGVTLAGILPCRFDRRRRAPRAMLETLQEAYGSLVLSPVPDRAELGELATHANGEPLPLYAPSSDALPVYRNVADRLFEEQH